VLVDLVDGHVDRARNAAGRGLALTSPRIDIVEPARGPAEPE
jgi:hypothetical protein